MPPGRMNLRQILQKLRRAQLLASSCSISL